MARIDKRITEWTRVSPSMGVRVVAAVNIVAALVIVGELTYEFFRYGTGWMEGAEGGAVGAWLAMVSAVILPTFFLFWLGWNQWFARRAAWPIQMAFAALMVPVFGIGIPFLIAFGRRSVRWQFGIGPDMLLAEIDALETVSVGDLASRFDVPAAVVRALLEQAIAAGAFAGAFEREADVVYSADTVVTRETIQRCPHCGGATKAMGNLACCPYCGTEFGCLSGLDYPMPMPIGLAVLRSFDTFLCYGWIVCCVMWTYLLSTYDLSDLSMAEFVKAYGVCTVLPSVFAVGYFLAGRWLERGLSRGWVLEACLLPLALPYLLLKRVRVLFGFGLAEIRVEYRREGTLPFAALGKLLKTSETRAADFAVFLTATETLDGVLDWHNRQVVSKERFASDGARRCGFCGAPYRLGGWCGYCGTGDTAGSVEGQSQE